MSTTANVQSIEAAYQQKLKRGFGLFHNIALGFGAISPVIGLYSTAAIGLALAGGAWLTVLPIALAGNCLLLFVYSQLARQYPIAGGAYQWTRRLVGPRYAWFTGWFSICGLIASLTTVAYLGAPWILSLIGVEATPVNLVICAVVFNLACAAGNTLGVTFLRRILNAGIVAEALASVLVGGALVLLFRNRPVSALWDFSGFSSLGLPEPEVFLAVLAVAGWAFIGFDACIAGAEETKNASRNVPRAIWVAMLSVGALVLLNAAAISLSHPDLGAVQAGADTDPITTAVAANFGAWSDKPFVVTVLIAFAACGLAANAMASRLVWSIARDDVLPGSRFLAKVGGRNDVPTTAILSVGVLACAGLLLALNSNAIATLIGYGTGGIYLTFLLVAVAALIGQLHGTWVPDGTPARRRTVLTVTALAVAWLAFQTVNIAWPREILNVPGAGWYLIWATPLVCAFILIAGIVYFLVAKPTRRISQALAVADAHTQALAVADAHAGEPATT
ncbi:APC family permease [Actinoplanes sp. CA-015351]|uniref:APC family permease n=1 Tax=Actinoplanes sp. CA-015351 TaxID=3239897 RepID=UPI003D956C46